LWREEKSNSKSKVKKMDKKQPFLPSLHTRGYLQIESVIPIDNGLPYVSAREKESLMLPKRTNDYTKLFSPLPTCDRG
jgi:hypothetical protein